MSLRESRSRIGLLVAVSSALALAGCAETPAPPPPSPGPTVTETVFVEARFDAQADAAENYDWFLGALDAIAGDKVTREEVLTAVSEATDAGWPAEATPGITTLDWLEADFVEVSLRDASGICLIGHVGFEGEVGATLAPVLESTDTCLLQPPTETQDGGE